MLWCSVCQREKIRWEAQIVQHSDQPCADLSLMDILTNKKNTEMDQMTHKPALVQQPFKDTKTLFGVPPTWEPFLVDEFTLPPFL